MWLVLTKLSLTTQNSIMMYAQACPFKGNLPPEHEIRYQFTVQQVGKGGKECHHPSYHSLHKIQSYMQTCSFEGNLLPESAPVHSTASGERRQRMWSFKLPLTTQNSILVQTCPFKGNLLAKSVPVHSAASGERRQRMWLFELTLSTQNSILRANTSIQR